MMLADPGGMEADFLGVDGFIEDVGDELVRGAGVVVVMVVAECEVAEIHFDSMAWVRIRIRGLREFNVSE
jgi:hypothetical protein